MIQFLKKMIDRIIKVVYNSLCVQEWRNWQTRRLQVPVAAMSCGFKSHFLQSIIRSDVQGDARMFVFSCTREYAEVSELADEQD